MSPTYLEVVKDFQPLPLYLYAKNDWCTNIAWVSYKQIFVLQLISASSHALIYLSTSMLQI